MARIAAELVQLLIRLMAAFPDARRDAKLTIGIYADGLFGFTLAELRAAIDRAIRELKFFPAVAELRDFAEAERVAALLAAAQAADGGSDFEAYNGRGEGLRRKGESWEDMKWRIRVRHFHAPQNAKLAPYWPDTFGPTPTQPGCQAPEWILAEFGYRLIPVPQRVPASDRTAWPAELTEFVRDNRPGAAKEAARARHVARVEADDAA